ncbi:MAG: hypothetical protein ACLR43_03995 [Faecalibacillus faecis]
MLYDPDGLPTGEIKDVKGTSFDFNEFAILEIVSIMMMNNYNLVKD